MTMANPVVPVVLPPDSEFLSQYFLTPLVSPTPVATRLPVPEDKRDTIHDFVRVESAGTVKTDPLSPNPWWEMSVLLHCYSRDEVSAMTTANSVAGHMASAQGKSVAGWYVVRVTNIVAAARLTDPMVNLIRYRAMATWCVTGHLL